MASKLKVPSSDGFAADTWPADTKIVDGVLEFSWPDRHVSRFAAKQLADSTPAG